MSRDYVIETRDLTKRFGDFTAVDRLRLAVPRGAIYGFIGSNGSGKSTAIRMIYGLLAPTAGTALVLGKDTAREPDRVKQSIGYMSQKFSLYLDLTAEENLDFYGSLYGLGKGERRARMEDVFALMRLEDRRRVPAGSLSGGQRQRLALGCAILHRPELLILDEPTSAVDPASRRLFWNLLAGLAAGGRTTILVTTHFMDEAEHCDRIGFLQTGRLIAEGSPAELKARLPGVLWSLRFPAPEDAAAAFAASGLPALETYTFGRQYRVLLPPDIEPPAALHPVREELSMEDVFIYYDSRR